MDLRCRASPRDPRDAFAASLTAHRHRHGGDADDMASSAIPLLGAQHPRSQATQPPSQQQQHAAAMQEQLRRLRSYEYDDEWLESIWRCLEVYPPPPSQHSRGGGSNGQLLNFAGVEVYLMELQVIAGTALMASASVLVPLLLPSNSDAKTPLRSVILTAIVGAVVLVRSALSVPSPALVELYRVLRNASPLYLGSLVVEGLAHVGCGDEGQHVLGARRSALLHLSALLLVLSGVVRAAWPTSRLDAATAVSALSLVVIGLLPMRLASEAGPFGDHHTLTPAESLARVARAAVFALMYTAFVIAGAPRHVRDTHPPLQTLRALGASAWTLCVPVGALLFGPLLVCLLAHRRVAVHVALDEPEGGGGTARRHGSAVSQKRAAQQASDIENSSSDTETDGMLGASDCKAGSQCGASLSSGRKSHLMKLLNGEATGVSAGGHS